MKKLLISLALVAVVAFLCLSLVNKPKAIENDSLNDRWEYFVSSGNEESLAEAISTAVPGSAIFIENGIYESIETKDDVVEEEEEELSIFLEPLNILTVRIHKRYYFSHENKGVFVGGYYIPNINAAFQTLSNSAFSLLEIGAGEYYLFEPLEFRGLNNLVIGEDSEDRPILANDSGNIINVSGVNNALDGFVFANYAEPFVDEAGRSE